MASSAVYFVLHLPIKIPRPAAFSRMEQALKQMAGSQHDSSRSGSPAKPLPGTQKVKIDSMPPPNLQSSPTSAEEKSRPGSEGKKVVLAKAGDGVQGIEVPTTNIARKIITELKQHVSDVLFELESPNGVQVSFLCDSLTEGEEILEYLKRVGVGSKFGSVNLAGCVRSYKARDFFGDRTESSSSRRSASVNYQEEAKTLRLALGLPVIGNEEGKASDEEWSGQMDMGLVGDRILENIRSGSALTIDFVLLTVVASLLAGVALAVDNTVVIVASMLVSPLMGPILAMTFSITNSVFNGLFFPALMVEILALAICIICGFVVGALFAPWGDRLSWPNSEMAGRGHVNGLFIGIGIAVPSGLGVALGLISNNVASLVGVAISASLLPPAVNCGMCWAYAMFGPELVLDSSGGLTPTIDTAAFTRLGGISLALTLLNIACIIVVAYLTFYLKIHGRYPGKSRFFNWVHHEDDALKTIKRNPKVIEEENQENANKSSLRDLFASPGKKAKALEARVSTLRIPAGSTAQVRNRKGSSTAIHVRGTSVVRSSDFTLTGNDISRYTKTRTFFR
ncbi:hypothetical protein AAMO2058_000251200 [Amorphochlora amoebiformis]